MAKKKMAKGFTCFCGENHRFHIYVASHWQDVLVFQCPKCERGFEVLEGVVTDCDTGEKMKEYNPKEGSVSESQNIK